MFEQTNRWAIASLALQTRGQDGYIQMNSASAFYRSDFLFSEIESQPEIERFSQTVLIEYRTNLILSILCFIYAWSVSWCTDPNENQFGVEYVYDEAFLYLRVV